MTKPSKHRQPQSALPTVDRQILRILEELLLEHRTLDVYWKIGEQVENVRLSIAEAPGGQRASRWRKLLAEKLHLSESTLNKCLQFRQSFNKKDVKRLKRLKIPWTQLSISFGFGDKTARIRLLTQAKDELWNVRELQREIQRVNGRRRGGGRKRKEPKSRGLLADVVELGRLSEVWNGFYEKVGEQCLGDGAGRVDKRIDVKVLGAALDHSLEEVKKIQQAAKNAMKSIGALLRKYPKPSA